MFCMPGLWASPTRNTAWSEVPSACSDSAQKPSVKVPNLRVGSGNAAAKLNPGFGTETEWFRRNVREFREI